VVVVLAGTDEDERCGAADPRREALLSVKALAGGFGDRAALPRLGDETKRCPWLKPALGARRIVRTMRSSVSRSICLGSYARTMRRRFRTSLKSIGRENTRR
jgi:hypothetical protein